MHTWSLGKLPDGICPWDDLQLQRCRTYRQLRLTLQCEKKNSRKFGKSANISMKAENIYQLKLVLSPVVYMVTLAYTCSGGKHFSLACSAPIVTCSYSYIDQQADPEFLFHIASLCFFLLNYLQWLWISFHFSPLILNLFQLILVLQNNFQQFYEPVASL